MILIRYALVLVGVVLCGMGVAQVQEGLPGFYLTRNVAELQGDANEILLGIAWLIGGMAAGVFALAFDSRPKVRVSPRPDG
ncbi:hypothetical protein [Paracoccus shanxieyensis]|uniref:Uncharacterized protein n=1 Tax=Paracoccus shanxieyensis TaxID=2675752 RepID=A0A6L6ITM4_9RHOB|nr:hypothetical protein [Paracoccus shanxieyensis]MTH62978.1 hypothetical protein [Paracoccus shanxieyensis]MTH85938.1 hypothetical protein [Paracoccus shanxieyensis]